jgi:molybdopterin-biosynthesis enzyme MoeA-like protein
MRVVVLNTGTELLLGDVQDAHLAFIAREILPLGLRISERRTVPDSPAIRGSLSELFGRSDIVFVTGGLGPTSDDITREIVADLLGLELKKSSELLASLRQRLASGLPALPDRPKCRSARRFSQTKMEAPPAYI